MNKSRLIVFVATLVAQLQRVSGQGFINLDFESALVPVGGSPDTVSASAAFPGWNVSLGIYPQSTVLYNRLTGAWSSVAILSGGSMGVFDGNFSALLDAGVYTNNPSLSQTGLVPSNANSLQLYASCSLGGGPSFFSVSLDGQEIQMVALQPFVGYSYILWW